MDLHAIGIKALHGALSGIMPSILMDVAIVYRWTKQNNQTFSQMFDWRASAKNLLGGVIGGVVGAFGLEIAGVNI